MFFGAQASPQTLLGYVEQMAERETAFLWKLKQVEREEITHLEQYPDVPYWKMAARFGQLEMGAHLRWAKETLNTPRQIAGNRRLRSARGKEEHNASQ